jgi:hypothetical protein
LPTNKAPGEDCISFETLKIVYPSSGEHLLRICNFIWEHEIIPEQWNTAAIRMIHKKGDIQDATNYRAIVLVSTLKQLYESLIRN